MSGPRVLFIGEEERASTMAEALPNMQLDKWMPRAEGSTPNLGYSPDIVVLDGTVSPESLATMCARIRAIRVLRHRPLLALASPNQYGSEAETLRSGADDFVRNPVSRRRLRARIEALVRQHRRAQETPEVLRIHELIFQVPASRVLREDHGARTPIPLPPRAFDLLLFLARRPGRVCPRSLLLDEVWPDEREVGARTVDVHVRIIRAALGNRYVDTVKGVGYRFPDQRSPARRTSAS